MQNIKLIVFIHNKVFVFYKLLRFNDYNLPNGI